MKLVRGTVAGAVARGARVAWGLGVAVALLALWQPWGAPAPTLLTAEEAPSLAVEQEVEARFARAWHALLAGDFGLAQRESAHVAAAIPSDPRPQLVGWLAQTLAHPHPGAAEHLAVIAEGLDPQAPYADVVRILLRPHNQRAALLARLHRHPEDYLTRLIWLSAVPWDDLAGQRAAIALLRSQQRGVVPAVFEVRWRLADEDWSGANKVLREALSRDPGTPVLLLLSGHLASAQGHPSHARELFSSALAADSGLLDARIGLANVALALGDLQGAANARAALLGPSIPVIDQVRFARSHADTLLGFGRAAAAAELLGQTDALAIGAGLDPAHIDPQWLAALALAEAETESTSEAFAVLLSRASVGGACARRWHQLFSQLQLNPGPASERALRNFVDHNLSACPQDGWMRRLLREAKKRASRMDRTNRVPDEDSPG